MKKISERLRELRLEHHISQSQLSKATGISQVAINYWENEKRIPNANAIISLARYFNVTVGYLVGEED